MAGIMGHQQNWKDENLKKKGKIEKGLFKGPDHAQGQGAPGF
jgi:hypothetical protein